MSKTQTSAAISLARATSALILLCANLSLAGDVSGRRAYNGPYFGPYLNRVAFPMGGMGAGMICLEGTGAISHVSVRNKPDVFHEPHVYAALCIKGTPNVAKVLEGPVPAWKIFGSPNTGNGAGGTSFGLPRFRQAAFLARFPFGTVTLEDPKVPLKVEVTGWSPFVPGDADESSLPVVALEYRFTNPTAQSVDAVFSFNSKNFMATGGPGQSILPIKNGFVLSQAGTEEKPHDQGAFAVFVDDDSAVVDHRWFKGGAWDSVTLVWRNIEQAVLMDNPPGEGSSPGASLFVPFVLKAGQEKTIQLMIAWYVPETTIRIGQNVCPTGPAFGSAPATGTAPRQQPVTGFLGKGLVNTFYPTGDGAVGTLTSPTFEIGGKYIHFLVGGGEHPGKTCVNLIIDNEVVRTATGRNSECLEWTRWDVDEHRGKKARIQIVDEVTGGWGHICVDQIMMCNSPSPDMSANLLVKDYDAVISDRIAVVLHDFESGDYGDWVAKSPVSASKVCCEDGSSDYGKRHVPWYASRFASIHDVIKYWRYNYEELRRKSALFRDTFYDTTLPDEVIEAIAANLTILKSPTVLRQVDGRLWCFEGCRDDRGCCYGSCTHVWNYAQAISHLFPDLERTLRQTEFNESMDKHGHQTFRSSLPIRPAGHSRYAAADGQLGGIMKVYREWRISGDSDWLKQMWPKVKVSLDYCISTWDPRGKGVLEEPHHNTYDIEYWGPNGHCTSFYLGALSAAVKMGSILGDDVARYRELLAKGSKFLDSELYNGEYFYQQVQTEGLNAKFQPISVLSSGPGYRQTTESINAQGPKYQYGTGCLSDGVLGFWMARVCGLGPIGDSARIRRHLHSVYKYNLRRDLTDHANPQRPAFAVGKDGGLLLCTWPRGGKPLLPFVYSDEVWTGIEYQVASHLMIHGMVEEGLDVVRICRDRYDGTVRNPFNEYECGHWYARALSSYGLIQGLTGIRYDAVDKTLYIDSKVGDDFRSFLSTATGFGTVGLKNQKPFVEVKMGEIEVAHVCISGRKTRL